MKAQQRSVHPAILYLALGACLYLVAVLAGTIYAAQQDLPRWDSIVNIAEWTVAILLLPRLLPCVFGIISEKDVKAPDVKAALRWFTRLAWVMLVLFGLSLITRAVMGLGFKPF